MILLGAIVNCAAVIAGGGFGLLLKRGLPEKLGTTIMNGLALCVIYIGVSGALKGENVLITILSITIGAFFGEWIDFDKKINQLGDWLQTKFKSNGNSPSISQGFVGASLLFCVGAMAIVGSLQSGLTGNHETLFSKSLIDGIAAVVLASTLGAGVLLSGGLLLLYEGAITLLAGVIEPYLTITVINEMTCVGSLLIIGLAFNMLKITNLKVMNYIPAVFLPIVLCMIL